MACSSASLITCVLHVEEGKNSDGQIIKFTDSTLSKCKAALLVYQSREKSKFKLIQLPAQPNDSLGYHPKCYKCFTAVSTAEKLKAVNQSTDHSEVNEATGIILSIRMISFYVLTYCLLLYKV